MEKRKTHLLYRARGVWQQPAAKYYGIAEFYFSYFRLLLFRSFVKSATNRFFHRGSLWFRFFLGTGIIIVLCTPLPEKQLRSTSTAAKFQAVWWINHKSWRSICSCIPPNYKLRSFSWQASRESRRHEESHDARRRL